MMNGHSSRKTMGATSKENLDEMISTKAYQSLPDADKQEAISNIYKIALDKAKGEFFSGKDVVFEAKQPPKVFQKSL